jgi:hypothetical protein
MKGRKIDDDELRRLWKCDMTLGQVAEALGATKQGVRSASARLGLLMRGQPSKPRAPRGPTPEPEPKPARPGYATVQEIAAREGCTQGRALQLFHRGRA